MIKYLLPLLFSLSANAQSIDLGANVNGGGGGGSGVSSINGVTGAANIVAGSGITVTVLGQNITIAATGGGTGTVTSVSVVSANGFAGTVATATTTPAITLTTSVTGILQGNGTAISAATTTGTGSVVLSVGPAFTGTPTAPTIHLTSLAVSSNVFTDGASNLTTTGTVAIAQGGTGAATTSQNFAFIGPTSGSGAPSFRGLVAGDIPSLSGTYLPLAGGTMSGQINMGSNKIVSVTDPTSAQDAATKNYVDTVASSLQPIQAVSLASASTNYPGVMVGNVFTITATGAISVDGSTPSAGQRILLKDQSTQSQNGVYVVTTVGSLGVSPVLTRAQDYNTAPEVDAGNLIPTISGTVNAQTSWLQTATVTTINTDPLVFAQWTANPANYLLKANNLSDVSSTTTAFNNISPTFTQGSVVFTNSSGKIAQDNANFFWDATNHRLGIGTTAPAYPLDIVTSTTSVSQALQTTAYGVNSMGFRTLKAEGTLGSPSAVLNNELLNFLSARGYGTTGFPTGATGAYQIAAEATFTDSSMPTDLRMLTTPTGSVTAVERMRIAPSGHVLIDTTTDGTGFLQLGDSFSLNGSSSGQFTQNASASTASYSVTWPAAQSSGTQVLQNNGSGVLSWANAGSGTVTSVTFTGDGVIDSATPSAAVTSSGTVTATIKSQNANIVLAGPTSGGASNPTFRSLVVADLPTGVGCAAVINSYAASTTMSDPGPGCQTVRVRLIGGGGGGASGGVAATSTGHSGGGGGSAGAYYDVEIPYSSVTWPVTITIGASAAGGTGSASGNGNAGTAGNTTSFGTYVVAVGGGAGSAGTAGAGNPAGGVLRFGSTPGTLQPSNTTNIPAAGGQSGATQGTTGGGGSGYAGSGGAGAGITSGNAGITGGNGGSNFNGATSAAGGASTGANGTNGTAGDASSPYVGFGGGGGGGGGSLGAGTSAFTGGNGGNYGAGGGGGTATLTGTTSGGGGSGAQGLMIVIVR